MKLQLRRFAAIVAVLCVVCGIMPLSASAVDIDPPASGNFTFLWTTDPQIYTNEYPHILSAQNDWVIENANRLNIKYAFHTGDLVHVYTDTSQWEFVSNEYKKWDDAGFAYGVLAGNHDMSGTDYSLYSRYFGASRYNNTETNWWYGGDYNDNYGHYDLRSTGGANFVFVYLSYGPHTQADYDWVNSVLQEHSDRIAILAVHEYMATSGGRAEQGEALFEQVILKNPNVRMVLCGHNYNSNRMVDEIDDNGDGVADRTVYQIMANYQYTSNGGNGFMRFMECDVANGTITHRTYSPYTASFGSDYEDGTILDEFGYRDEFVTPFDFSDPTPKAAGDPISGTVVYTSEMSFAPTATLEAVTLPVAYQNKAEAGTVYQGVGVYDRFFSLDAADAFTDPTAVNYVVTEYTQTGGHTVSKVIRGASLGTSAPRVPIPQNGAVVVLPADAAIALDDIVVGRRIMLNKLTAIATPSSIHATNITVPSWGGMYSLDGINRVVGNGEWVLYDSLSTASYTHERDMVFTFAPVSGSVYTVTAALTTIGEAKSPIMPQDGFMLAVNTCYADPMLIQSMSTHFKQGLQVRLNGHTPGVASSYETVSLLAPSVGGWSCDSTMVVAQSGNAQVFYNTDSLYPDANYTYSTPVTINPASMVLHYDLLLETDARTSIGLFFASDSGNQSVTMQSYIDGATLSTKSGDMKGDSVRREGKIDLTTMAIPASCYNADGTLTLKSIRIFASGTADKKLHIYTLAMTTDRSETGEVVIPQNVPLLSDAIAVSTATKAGSYVYDNGTLSVSTTATDGYEIVVDLGTRYKVSELKYWLIDVEATTRFDIQLIVTTASGEASYGLVSDFWPNLCAARDGDYIPAGIYAGAQDLCSSFTWNKVLPADGITTVKQVKILLGGAGALHIHALQTANTTQAGRFADGIYATETTPKTTPESDVYVVGDVYVENIPVGTTAEALLDGMTATTTLTITQNGVAVTANAPVATGMTIATVDGAITRILVVYGDVDGDGAFTTADARTVLQHSINALTLEGAALVAADYDHDGAINTADARDILRASL